MAVTTTIYYRLYNPGGSTVFNPNNDIYLSIASDALVTSGPSYQPWTVTFGNPPWETYKLKIKRIFINNSLSDIIYPQYCSTWFRGCISLEYIDISKLDTSNVTNMFQMFYNCKALTSLDLSDFDTSNVTNMDSMFNGCYALTSLDVSGFDTSNVTNMNHMFSDCKALTSLDVSSFNTSNVTDIYNMFSSCTSLTSLDLSGFDTSNVTSMGSMFSGCYTLTSLDISDFNTSNVTSMSSMFYNCNALTSLDVSDFNTSNVTNMRYMFYGCYALTSLDVSGFDTSNVTDMYSMFYNCEALTSLDVSGFDTSNVTDMDSMFYNCKVLASLDVSDFNTSNVTSMSSMFCNCNALTSLDVSGFNTSNVTDMDHMFGYCNALTSLDISGFDTSNVTDMDSMFRACNALTSLDVSGFNTSKVKSMYYMFRDCNALTSLDVSGFDTSNVTSMTYMFNRCNSLTSLDVSGFDTSNVTNMSYMFYGCENFSGDVFINCDPQYYSNMFSNTTKPIYLFGTSTILPQLAATANNGNVILWSLSDTLKADRDEETPTSAILSVTVSRFRGNNETLSDIKVYKEPSTTPMVLTWDDPTFTMDSAVKEFNTTLYNLDEAKTHSIRVVVEDAYGTADAKIVSIPTVYYTIDFLAGGKEISFGEKATKDDLYSPVTGSSAPTFASDTYYERSVNGVSITYTLLDEEPNDWANTYSNYYTLTRQNGLFKCAMDTAFNDMDNDEISDVLEAINYSGSAAADYVVEQGITNDGWTFRKWQSGIAECWGSFLHNTTVSGAWGNGFLSNVKVINFPTDLFIAPPPGLSAYVDSTFAGLTSCENQVATKDWMRCYVFRTSSTGTTAANFYFHIEAKGRWK